MLNEIINQLNSGAWIGIVDKRREKPTIVLSIEDGKLYKYKLSAGSDKPEQSYNIKSLKRFIDKYRDRIAVYKSDESKNKKPIRIDKAF